MNLVATRDLKKVCSRIGFALFAMMLVQLVASVLLVVPVLFAGYMYPSSVVLEWLMSTEGLYAMNAFALYVLGAGAFFLILRGVPSVQATQPQPMKMNPGKYILILLFCFGASYAANVAMTLVLLPFQLMGQGSALVEETVTALPSIRELVSNFVFLACFPALVEEFLFRYMLRRKLGGCSDTVYILFSSLCFSLFHLDIRMLPYTFIVGVVFGWVYVKTGKIWYTIGLHFLYNLFGGILMPMLDYFGVAGAVALFIWMGSLIILAIVLFCVFFKRIRATLSPPTEPGWPYRVPKWQRKQQEMAQNAGGLALAAAGAGGGMPFAPMAGVQGAVGAQEAGGVQMTTGIQETGVQTAGQMPVMAPPAPQPNSPNGPFRNDGQIVSYRVMPGMVPSPYGDPGAGTMGAGPAPVAGGQGYAPYYGGAVPTGTNNAYYGGPVLPSVPNYGVPGYGVGTPAYGQAYPGMYGGAPYYVPVYSYPVPMPAPVPVAPQKPATAGKICFGNAGMITFLSLAGTLSLLTLLAIIVLPALTSVLQYLLY